MILLTSYYSRNKTECGHCFLISGLKDLEAKYNVVSILLLVSSTSILKIAQKKKILNNKVTKNWKVVSECLGTQMFLGITFHHTSQNICFQIMQTIYKNNQHTTAKVQQLSLFLTLIIQLVQQQALMKSCALQEDCWRKT